MPEKKSLPLPNGETYAYLDQGAGDTVLLIHGNMSSSVHYKPFFERIGAMRLVAPDLRGFGDSSYNSRFSTMLELAEDVKMFADALGIKKAHIAGWSAGGPVAFELAVKYPEFVQSLFIIQGAGHKGYPLYRRSPDGTYAPFGSKEELAADPRIAAGLSAFSSKNKFSMNMIWKATIYTGKKPSFRDNKLYISETLKQRNLVDLDWALINFNMSNEHNRYTQGTGEIGKIRCPVAFTCAELDKVVPPATVRENAAAISGSKLLVYEKSGHSPLVDCPDRIAADLLAHTGTAK